LFGDDDDVLTTMMMDGRMDGWMRGWMDENRLMNDDVDDDELMFDE